MKDREELRLEVRAALGRLRRSTRQRGVLDFCDLVDILLADPVANKTQLRAVTEGLVEGMKRVGRPPLLGRPLTATERTKRWREKKKHALRGPALTEVGDGGRRRGPAPAKVGEGK